MGSLVIIRPSINIFWATDQKNKNKIDHPYVDQNAFKKIEG
jgi:hypothetical protein